MDARAIIEALRNSKLKDLYAGGGLSNTSGGDILSGGLGGGLEIPITEDLQLNINGGLGGAYGDLEFEEDGRLDKEKIRELSSNYGVGFGYQPNENLDIFADINANNGKFDGANVGFKYRY